MRFSNNADVYIRRALLLLLIVFSALLQNTGVLPELFLARAMVLIPVCVVTGMFERSMGGLFFGAAAGILWDFATVRGDGFFGVCLACVGYLSGVAVTYLLRRGIISALLLSTLACLGVNLLYWLVFVLSKDYDGAVRLLQSFYIPSAIYSAAFTFIYYPLINGICRLCTSRARIKGR